MCFAGPEASPQSSEDAVLPSSHAMASTVLEFEEPVESASPEGANIAAFGGAMEGMAR